MKKSEKRDKINVCNLNRRHVQILNEVIFFANSLQLFELEWREGIL